MAQIIETNASRIIYVALSAGDRIEKIICFALFAMLCLIHDLHNVLSFVMF